jgi:hypothetical protein
MGLATLLLLLLLLLSSNLERLLRLAHTGKKIHIHIPLAAAVACSSLLHAPALDAQSTFNRGWRWNGGAGVDPLAAAASAASSSPLDAGSALSLSHQFISTHCFSFSRRLSGPI